MFRRSFMEGFKIRKNSNVTGYLGSITSNFAYVGQFDKKVARTFFFLMTTLLFYNASNNF